LRISKMIPGRAMCAHWLHCAVDIHSPMTHLTAVSRAALRHPSLPVARLQPGYGTAPALRAVRLAVGSNTELTY
jgi:hypothetical protein